VKLLQVNKIRFGAMLALLCLAAVCGCSLTRNVEGRLENIEDEIQRRSSEIQEEFKATITNMAVEHRQFLKCEEIVRSWRMAQSSYFKDFGAYAAELDAMQGNNPLKKYYVDKSVPGAMTGVCYVIEMNAADTDYRMLFEMDKQALVQQYENQLDEPDQDTDTREYLERRISQLRTAAPCQIVATEQESKAGGQCGFAAQTSKN
jgi:hypothetical protein